MKLNKIASAVILSAGMLAFGVNAADQGSGSVTFVGNIIDAPCSISPETVDQTVEIGQVAKGALLKGGKSKPTHFKIDLENCVLDSGDASGGTTRAAANTVTIKFQGGVVDTAKQLLKIEGGAEGAGVGITDPKGKAITFGDPSSAIELVDTATNTLDFYGHLQGLGKDAELKEGSFQAITHFTMDYQ